HTDLLAEYFTPDDPRALEVAAIRQAAERAATLTRKLLAFSGTQILQPAVVDLSDLVDRSRPSLSRLVGDAIDLAINVERPLRNVNVDPAQVHHILRNLAINARDAMPEGGRLAIDTRNVYLDAAGAGRLGAGEGDYVALSVSDTGDGLGAATLAHLFEPFVTSEEHGRRTRLGLATVYRIVKQSGGHIGV